MPSNRSRKWRLFSTQVNNHIESYTIPQYGDWPKDLATSFTIDDITMSMTRYIHRAKTNARGLEDRKRDCFKLAHYANMLYEKICEEEVSND